MCSKTASHYNILSLLWRWTLLQHCSIIKCLLFQIQMSFWPCSFAHLAKCTMDSITLHPEYALHSKKAIWLSWNQGKPTLMMCLLNICVYYMFEHTQEIASTHLGKSLTRFILNLSLQVLVCFVSQEHDGNILSCALLQKKNTHTHTHI